VGRKNVPTYLHRNSSLILTDYCRFWYHFNRE